MLKKNKEYIKSISIVLFGEAIIYFLIKTIIHDYNLMTPKINFPLIKEFIYIYNLWYPFLFISAYKIYKSDKNLYKNYIYVHVISIVLSELTFLIYPTLVIRPKIEITGLTTLILHLTYYFDTPAVNCLPSVHCLLCFINIYFILKNKNIRTLTKTLMTLFFILIIFSTLLTKQHLLIDVILAFIYSSTGIILTKIFNKQLKKALKFLF